MPSLVWLNGLLGGLYTPDACGDLFLAFLKRRMNEGLMYSLAARKRTDRFPPESDLPVRGSRFEAGTHVLPCGMFRTSDVDRVIANDRL